MKRISSSELYELRNTIAVNEVIEFCLQIPCERVNGLLRFRCPLCAQFNSATNPATNLARCFLCSKNFNPIDIVISVRKCSFSDAVRILRSYQYTKLNQQQTLAFLVAKLSKNTLP
jgi:hypothetical protein